MRRGPNVIQSQSIKMDDTYLTYEFILPDNQILNVAATFQKCKDN